MRGAPTTRRAVDEGVGRGQPAEFAGPHVQIQIPVGVRASLNASRAVLRLIPIARCSPDRRGPRVVAHTGSSMNLARGVIKVPGGIRTPGASAHTSPP